MFDFDAGKILIVGVMALIFIPPKDLPRVMRQVGQLVGKMRRMASEFQGQFMDAMREADMADLRKEAQKLSDAARVDVGLPSVHDLDPRTSMMARQQAPIPAPAATSPTTPSTGHSSSSGSDDHFVSLPEASFENRREPAAAVPTTSTAEPEKHSA